MKKVISLLLVIVSVCSVFGACLGSFAAAPALTIKGKAYDNYYKVTWAYDSGAVKYNVYVDGKYDGVKKATSAKSYTFTTDPYSAGVCHTIQVIAYDKKGNVIVKSNKINRYLPPLVPTLSYTRTSTGYTISAKVASGTVHGYALYKYNASKDKYEFYKNFKKSIAIKKGNTNYKDTYRAKAYVTYAKSYYSALSDYITCVPNLGKLTLKSASSKEAGKVALTWAKPSYSDFTGYQIVYTSYDSFSIHRTQTISKKYSSYTLNLIPGVCYKIKMRTYRDTSGGKIFGSYSAVKTLYTKAKVGASPDVKTLLNKKVTISSRGNSGCTRLNNALDRILQKIDCTEKSKRTTYEKLRLAYRYIATEQFKKNGSLGAIGNASYNNYAAGAVLRMLENKGATGSCYEYNYLFHFLCLRMGLKNTYCVDGMVSASGGGRTNHWWVMMKIDGNNYFYDPRMQRYMSSNKDFNFFNLPMNGSNHYSDYYRFYDAKAELQ